MHLNNQKNKKWKIPKISMVLTEEQKTENRKQERSDKK